MVIIVIIISGSSSSSIVVVVVVVFTYPGDVLLLNCSDVVPQSSKYLTNCLSFKTLLEES